MKRLVVIGTLALGLSLVLSPSAAAKVQKYTFDPVTYPDGSTGVIEASVKTTNKSDLSYCGYFTDDYMESLGYYQAQGFATDDPDVLLQWCLDHFEDRWS